MEMEFQRKSLSIGIGFSLVLDKMDRRHNCPLLNPEVLLPKLNKIKNETNKI